MFGPKILVDSLVLRPGSPKPFAHGNHWQYHSRSDHHSKVACWGLMFDLLHHCALLRSQATAGLVGFGLNHEMRDFKTGRKKDLDLVICRPRRDSKPKAGTPFAQRAVEIGAVLDVDAQEALEALPAVKQSQVGATHVAVEAKACMTAHVKSLPRLYDELNSSHLAVHGSSEHTIAAGLAMVNRSSDFISPGRNNFDLSTQEPVVTQHKQPGDTIRVIEKLHEIPRRTKSDEAGFDAFGITVVDCRNNGSPIELVKTAPAPQPGDIYHYEQMVHRLAHLYEQKFSEI